MDICPTTLQSPFALAGEPKFVTDHKKFQREWGNQTDIGRHFNMSAVAIGRFLTDQGLRDPVTKAASERALAEGYSKSTPLKDGTPFFMWNRYKVGQLLQTNGTEKATPVDYHTKRVHSEMARLLKSTDDDKLDRLAYEVWPDVLRDFLQTVPVTVRRDVSSAVLQRLQREGLLEQED